MAKGRETLGYIVLGPRGPMNLFDMSGGGRRLLYSDRQTGIEVFPTYGRAMGAVRATKVCDKQDGFPDFLFRIRRVVRKTAPS